jgi:hypothetical protein
VVAGNLFEQQKNRAVIRYQQVIALAFRNTISRIKQLAQSANELECPDFMNPQRRMAYLSIPAQLCSLIYYSFDFEAVGEFGTQRSGIRRLICMNVHSRN